MATQEGRQVQRQAWVSAVQVEEEGLRQFSVDRGNQGL